MFLIVTVAAGMHAKRHESSVVSAVGHETSLSGQWRGGQLREAVQLLCSVLPGATRPDRVKRLTWPLTDYERSLKYFTSVQG